MENDMTTKKKTAPVARTSSGLRDAIFDELEALRNRESNPTRANAVAKLATSVVETVRMEIDVQKHIRTFPQSQLDQQVSSESTPMGGNLKLAG